MKPYLALVTALLLEARVGSAQEPFSEQDIEWMGYFNTRPQRIISAGELADRVASLKLANASPALATQFPFAASISYGNVHTCGAVLISPRALLTAAHCVTNFADGSIKEPESMSVRVGNIVRGEGPEHTVHQVVIPEVYALNSSFLGDIALLELEQAVDTPVATLPAPPVVEPSFALPSSQESPAVNETVAGQQETNGTSGTTAESSSDQSVQPSAAAGRVGISLAGIALAAPPSTTITTSTTSLSTQEPNTTTIDATTIDATTIDATTIDATTTADLPLTAIGWGYTSEVSMLSTSLMEALLTRLPDEECEAFHQSKGLGTKPVDHFCAGDSTGADTCRGDSGGPILEGDFDVIGITSYGASDSKCGAADGNSTGVYTSVAFWRPWILDSLSLYNMGGESRPSRLVTPEFFSCWSSVVPESSSSAAAAAAAADASSADNLVTSRALATSVGECADRCRDDVRCLSFQFEFGSTQCSLSMSPGVETTASSACHSGRVSIGVDRLLENVVEALSPSSSLLQEVGEK